MKINKKDLELSVEKLGKRVSDLTNKPIEYKLVMGDARLGKVYSIQNVETTSTICSFMVARELDAYIWGMYKVFDILDRMEQN